MAQPRPAVAAESSACGRGRAVGQTSILDLGQFFMSKLPCGSIGALSLTARAASSLHGLDRPIRRIRLSHTSTM